MLAALRTVLLTLSSNFSETIFFRLPGMKETPDVIMEKFMDPAHRPAGGEIPQGFCIVLPKPEPGRP